MAKAWITNMLWGPTKMLFETQKKVEYVYYVCDEYGHTIFEFYDEMDAREESNKYEGYSISKKQLLTED